MKRVSPLHSAFTLMELIVAVSVLSLMMFLATRIFYDAQSGVQRGLQTSQIIATSRSLSQPLTDDVRNMNVFSSKYESNSPGFLIITQQNFTATGAAGNPGDGIKSPHPDRITDDTNSWTTFRDDDNDGVQDAGEPFNSVRSDQIAFFRDANDLESLTPGQDDRYDSLASARFARIWYGHVWPADVTPSPAAANDQPGQEGYDLISQLVLGRQALLLVENDAATRFPDGTDGDNPGGVAGNTRIADGGNSFGQVRTNTFLGEQDVLNLHTFNRLGIDFSVFDDQGVDAATIPPFALFRTPTYDTPTPTTPSYFGLALGAAGGLPNGTYANFAREWMYTIAGQRLRAQTSLDTDFSGSIFAPDDLARLHAAFAPHVADFVVEIAADWTDDLDPTDWDGDNNFTEPDGQPDFEPDRDGAGNIRWYTLINPNPDLNNNSVGDNDPTAPVTYDATLFNVSPFDGTAASAAIANPFIYYTNSTFVFSHTGDDISTDEVTNPNTGVGAPGLVEGCGKYWPYLIRFRYRLLDGKGEFRSIQTNPDSNFNGTADDPEDFSVVGRWFEQVVPVPRPQGLY
ncbi:MAG: prepilin-type N-terminal cleavage/methylation domain-containing protein [Planctomycetota bacterium]